MTEINLRHYVQEIDDIIEDSDRLEEAIAHCRHVLQSFPKHIDTYRLLGKAYLESKRFGDAADIFQRVLSALPEDYVSHVGMAIIREDEGNLDAAIWHMERSSEAKPGNAAIEQELKRLIGKRDGLEPQRVRPTRGALARMYSHGELFSYAITELKRALEEDPDRPDLQVLLANTFWRTDQRLEAARLCSNILEKLPYCRDANRITAALLLETGKTSEAGRNLRRLVSLDPYFANLKNPMDDPLSVEASAIELDKLVWMHGEPIQAKGEEQPDWAASLGVDFRGDTGELEELEEVPDWLQAKEEEEREASPQKPQTGPIPIHPFAGAEPPPGADIPQWMQEAGWVEGDGTAADATPEQIAEIPQVPGDTEDIAAAEFPDWLSQITPSEDQESVVPAGPSEFDEPDSGDSQAEESFLDALRFDTSDSDVAAFAETESEELFEAAEDDVFGMEDPPMDAFETAIPGMDVSDTEVSDTEAPDWMSEITSEPLEPAEIESTEEPALDLFTAMGVDDIPGEIPDEPLAEETIDEPLAEETIEDQIPAFEPETSDALPDLEQVADPDDLFSGFEEFEAEEEAQDLPSWLEPAMPGATDTIVTWLGDKSGDELPAPSDDVPTWMRGTGPLIEKPTDRSDEIGKPPTIEAPQDDPGVELDQPSDLFGEPEPRLTDSSPSESAPSVEAPDANWLDKLSEVEPPLESPISSDAPEWIDEVSVEGDQIPGIEKEDTPDWLSEAAEVEGDFEEPVSDGDPPEWLQEFTDVEGEEELSTQEEEPEWLTSVDVVTGDSEGEPAIEDEQPEWLQTLAESPAGIVEEAEPVEEDPPEWISEMAPSETEEPSAEETPQWLQELDTESQQTPQDEGEIEFDQELIVPEVEVSPGIEEPVAVEPSATVDPEGEQAVADEDAVSMDELIEEDAPDWLQELAFDELTTPPEELGAVDFTEPEAAETTEPEAADWLKKIETESTGEISPSPLLDEPIDDVVEELRSDIETETTWEPEFEEPIAETEEEMDTADLIAAEKEIESRLEWLQESAQEVAPEPGVPEPGVLEPSIPEPEVSEPGVPEPEDLEPGVPELGILEPSIPELDVSEPGVPEPEDLEPGVPEPAVGVTEIPEDVVSEAVQDSEPVEDAIADHADSPLGEEEVLDYLEGLADKVADVSAEEPSVAFDDQPAEVDGESLQVVEAEELPEDLDAGLEWLEELASEDEYEEVIAPDFRADEEAMADSEVPEWLEEVAESPEDDLPKAEDIGLEFIEIEGDAEVPPPEEDPSILDTIVTKRPVFDTIEFDRAMLERETPEEISELEEAEDRTDEFAAEPAPGLIPDPSEPPIFEEEIEEPEQIQDTEQDLADEAEDEDTSLGLLERARRALESGKIDRALEHYSTLIDEKQDLDAVTDDLLSAVENTPMSPILWQTLGDAYMQNGQVTDAINAYRKGMEAV
jgi:tetratricopeptide (TPR) repeat protein